MVYVALNVLDFECVGELYSHLMTFSVKYEYWYISLKYFLRPLGMHIDNGVAVCDEKKSTFDSYNTR